MSASGGVSGDRVANGGGTGPGLNPAAGELLDAMKAGKGSGEGSPRLNEGEEAGLQGKEAGGVGTGAGSRGGSGGAGDGEKPRGLVPLNVFTRGEAARDTYNPLLYGCRSVDNYERITFIDEGAYGKVYCALNKITGEVVALKQVKLTRDNGKEGFPITALRETNVLLSLHNPNIVRVLEMVVGSTLDRVYMVMEYFDHDLKSVMRHLREQKVGEYDLTRRELSLQHSDSYLAESLRDVFKYAACMVAVLVKLSFRT